MYNSVEVFYRIYLSGLDVFKCAISLTETLLQCLLYPPSLLFCQLTDVFPSSYVSVLSEASKVEDKEEEEQREG